MSAKQTRWHRRSESDLPKWQRDGLKDPKLHDHQVRVKLLFVGGRQPQSGRHNSEHVHQSALNSY